VNTLADRLSVFRTPVCLPWLRSLYPGFGFALCGFGEGFGAGDPTVSTARASVVRESGRQAGAPLKTSTCSRVRWGVTTNSQMVMVSSCR